MTAVVKQLPIRGLPTLEQFLESGMRVSWIKFTQGPNRLEVYVRKCDRLHPGIGGTTTLDVANIVAKPQSSGLMTAFLDHVEPLHSIYIENVTKERFRDFFIKRGYSLLGPVAGLQQTYPYCLVRIKP